jgi:hypothetical protein
MNKINLVWISFLIFYSFNFIICTREDSQATNYIKIQERLNSLLINTEFIAKIADMNAKLLNTHSKSTNSTRIKQLTTIYESLDMIDKSSQENSNNDEICVDENDSKLDNNFISNLIKMSKNILSLEQELENYQNSDYENEIVLLQDYFTELQTFFDNILNKNNNSNKDNKNEFFKNLITDPIFSKQQDLISQESDKNIENEEIKNLEEHNDQNQNKYFTEEAISDTSGLEPGYNEIIFEMPDKDYRLEVGLKIEDIFFLNDFEDFQIPKEYFLEAFKEINDNYLLHKYNDFQDEENLQQKSSQKEKSLEEQLQDYDDNDNEDEMFNYYNDDEDEEYNYENGNEYDNDYNEEENKEQEYKNSKFYQNQNQEYESNEQDENDEEETEYVSESEYNLLQSVHNYFEETQIKEEDADLQKIRIQGERNILKKAFAESKLFFSQDVAF